MCVCVSLHIRGKMQFQKQRRSNQRFFLFERSLAHIPENGKDGYLVIALLSKLDKVVITTRTPR